MAIRFTIDGIAVSTDTADEAAALIERLRATPSASVVARQHEPRAAGAPLDSKPNTSARPTETKPPSKPIAMLTLEFLRTVREAGASGADADKVLSAVHADHPKGIGSKLAMINEYLKSKHGITDLDEVYVSERGTMGRIWTSGPRLDDAIDTVQEVIDAQSS